MSETECKIIMQWMDYLPIGIFQAVITGVVWFLASYLKAKGKNLATSEDIKEITDKIESAKTEYAKELEGLKSQLNAKFHAHTVRFEKEFKVYERIWETLIELRNATVKLRPPGDYYTREDHSPEEEKQKRFEEYREAFKAFYLAFYGNKPFFHPEVFSCLKDLTDVIFSEASEFYKRLESEITPHNDP